MAKSVDILMKLVDSSGAIAAESQSRFNQNDEFMQGFELGKFFDVLNFDFGVKLHDSSEGHTKPTGGTGGAGAAPSLGRSAFSSWLGFTGNLRNFAGYPVDVDEFEFKRQFDVASPILFQLCATSAPLKSATLVQRKAGSSQSQMGISPCYLRIDFFDVLLTSVGWDVEDEGVEEKVKFVSRRISVQYRPQKPDGTLGSPVNGNWSFDAKVAPKGPGG